MRASRDRRVIDDDIWLPLMDLAQGAVKGFPEK